MDFDKKIEVYINLVEALLSHIGVGIWEEYELGVVIHVEHGLHAVLVDVKLLKISGPNNCEEDNGREKDWYQKVESDLIF